MSAEFSGMRPRSPLVVRKSGTAAVVSEAALAAFAPVEQRGSPTIHRMRRVMSAAAPPTPLSPPPRTVTSPTGTLRRSLWKRLSGGATVAVQSAPEVFASSSPPSPTTATSDALFALSQASTRPPPTLEDTLASAELSLAFWRHLKAQDAAENVTFLLELARLESLDAPSLEDRRTAAQQLFKRYFAEGCAREANVSQPSRDALRTALFDTATPPPDGCGRWADAFDGVRSEVLSMLEPVLYPAWLATGEWRFYQFSPIADKPPNLETVLRTPRLLHSFRTHLSEESRPLADFLCRVDGFLQRPNVPEARKIISDYEAVVDVDSLSNPLTAIKEARITVLDKLNPLFGAWLEVKANVWGHRRYRSLSRGDPPSLCSVLSTPLLYGLLQNFVELAGDADALAMLSFLREAASFVQTFAGTGKDSPNDARRMKTEAQRIAETYLTPLHRQLVTAVPQGVRQSTIATCGLGATTTTPEQQHGPQQLSAKVFSKPVAHVLRALEIGIFREWLDTFCWVNTEWNSQNGNTLESDFDLQRSPRP